MRASFSALAAALLSLHASTAYGITCNSDSALGTGESLSAKDALEGANSHAVNDLCNSNSNGAITYHSGLVTFSVTGTNANLGAADCKSVFQSIVQQCIVEKGFSGGSLNAYGGRFEVYRDSGLERRGKKKPPTKPPPSKPTSKKADAPPKTSEAPPPPSSAALPPPPPPSSAPPPPPPSSSRAPPPSSTAPAPSTSSVLSASAQVSSSTPAPSTKISSSAGFSVSTTGASNSGVSTSLASGSTASTSSATSALSTTSTSLVSSQTSSATTVSGTSSSATLSLSTSSISSTTSSVSCVSGTKTLSGAACSATTSSCKIANPDRGIDVDDVSGRGLGYRSPRHAMLQKRDRKSGNPCWEKGQSDETYKSFSLESNPYPSNGDLPATAKAYGYELQNDYCSYKWQSGSAKIPSNKYDSEHVMEWQLVTDFFRGISKSGGDAWVHPDPAQNGKKVNFCTYWIESWGGANKDGVSGFAIDSSSALTPWEHIAGAYPSTMKNKDEFVTLQDNINKPAKANLFDERVPYVWTEATMNSYAQTTKKRDKVLERLRQLHGAQLYLVETTIKKIFKDQKTRMGDILGKLDTQMTSHPRTAVDPATSTVTTYTAWAKQDLKDKWDSYMDKKWEAAVDKHKKVFDKYYKALHDKWCKKTPDAKDAPLVLFCKRLANLKNNHDGAGAFAKPW